MNALEVVGRSGLKGALRPSGHGPDFCNSNATRLNSSASGQHEASETRMRLAVSVMRPAIFRRRRPDGGELALPGGVPGRRAIAQIEQQPIGGGVQNEAELVGQRRTAVRAV